METNETRHRILILDDDPDLLDAYREILGQLPSQPLVRTANSGARGLAMLESEPFRLLICDLKMPRMDGLQVLSIVRRKFPQLRTVVLTSVMDEQFRSRAYALGVDLFWQKPGNEEDLRMFLECLESLLGREEESGFRGVQSKSLVDIIQLECLAQSTSVLRINNGPLSGKIWIQDGELIDAETADLRGEPAFSRILSWKAGHFEILPAEPSRPRTIFKSYNALLLESAQALDEQLSGVGETTSASPDDSRLAQLAEVEGLEFFLKIKHGEEAPQVARGLENPKEMTSWANECLSVFRALGDRLQAGPLQDLQGLGLQRNVGLATRDDLALCVGCRQSMTPGEVRDAMRRIVQIWAC